MISLLLPYWDRQATADAALARLDALYAGIDMEVIVVDDGNRVPFRVPDTKLNIRVLRMPVKDKPSSPVRAWNQAAKEAKGEILILSCIEVLHEQPVLQKLSDALKAIGEWGYVAAAAWCPDTQEWHCHSSGHSHGGPQPPGGAGRPFCAAIYRGLFATVGGFDERFMAGVGYEDLDFLRTLKALQVNCVIRDDLVVIHPKAGAQIKWPAESFAVNEKLYREKWAC